MQTTPRVLVVDDEALIAALVADWLVELGCEVVGPVRSAAEALPLLDQQVPAAALLDVSLGAGDSFSLADRLRDRGIPLAFLTGHTADRLPARFKGSPVLGKPFDFEAVQAVVAALLLGSVNPSQ
jgi:DNA-binding response OmpR family regulator